MTQVTYDANIDGSNFYVTTRILKVLEFLKNASLIAFACRIIILFILLTIKRSMKHFYIKLLNGI